MPGLQPSDPWRGTLEARDDVRHTYEQVFYGRQLTGDIEPLKAPAGLTHEHAELYAGIWGETLPPEPDAGGIHGAPQLDGPVIDGTATLGAPEIEAPTIEAPVITAPAIEPPAPDQGDDMVPGY